MEKEEMVSLANLGRGAAIEQFDEELLRVIQNIMDPNTPATVKREIVIKVEFKPSERRDFCIVKVFPVSKLAMVRGFETQVFIGRDTRGFLATEHDPKQLGMFDPAEKISAGLKNRGEQDD